MLTALHTLPPLEHQALHAHAAALRRHLAHCQAARGRWFSAAALAESAHRVLAPRFVTTIALVALVMAVASGWA